MTTLPGSLVRYLVLIIGFCALGIKPLQAAESIRFAPLPLVEERTMRGQFLPMLDYLAQHTKMQFEWSYLPRYDDVLKALSEGKLDLAYLGPLPYVTLTEKDRHFEPLVHFLEKDGSHGYDCALVAFAPDALTRTADITGKHIGLTQPEATCGHFAVSVMLDRAGRSLDGEGNRYEYAGGHDKAILGVVRGTYDVAGAKLAIAKRYANLGTR